jgi:hypothetical protein
MLPPLETVLCHYTRTQGKLAQQLHVPRLVYMSSILKDDPAHQWKNASSVIKSRRQSTTSSSHARSRGKFGGIFSPRSEHTTHRSEGTPSYLGGALGGNDVVAWELWKERNARCFRGKSANTMHFLAMIRHFANLWIDAGTRHLGCLVRE